MANQTSTTPKQDQKGCIALIIIIAVMFLFFKACNCSASSSSSEGEDIDQAYIIAKDFVEENLKAPSTANFTGEYSYGKLGKNEYSIKSQVDAENSFGAKIRSNWQVKLKYNGGEWTNKNNWTLEYIQIY